MPVIKSVINVIYCIGFSNLYIELTLIRHLHKRGQELRLSFCRFAPYTNVKRHEVSSADVRRQWHQNSFGTVPT